MVFPRPQNVPSTDKQYFTRLRRQFIAKSPVLAQTEMVRCSTIPHRSSNVPSTQVTVAPNTSKPTLMRSRWKPGYATTMLNPNFHERVRNRRQTRPPPSHHCSRRSRAAPPSKADIAAVERQRVFTVFHLKSDRYHQLRQFTRHTPSFLRYCPL